MITIRQEKPNDHKAVSTVIKKAFENEAFSDHGEHLLVERLRKYSSFVPELSLVAEYDKKIVGHILLTPIKICGIKKDYDSLALAPVSVRPDCQGMGVGSALITAAHNQARKMGHTSIVLVGHENYYPRFGYRQASEFGISFPFNVPQENCMVIELVKGGLNGVNGMVEYPPAFRI